MPFMIGYHLALLMVKDITLINNSSLISLVRAGMVIMLSVKHYYLLISI